MLAYSGNERVWQAFGAPDSNVNDGSVVIPMPGDIYFSQELLKLYLCTVSWGDPQVWKQFLFEEDIQALLVANQSNWSQTDNSKADYIKNKPVVPPAQIQSNWTQNNASSLDYIKNKPTIPAAQIQSDWSQTNTAALDYIKNKPAAAPAITQTSATRALNTAFQISATRGAFANYSIDIQTTLSLAGGQSGTVIFEIAPDASFTTGVQEVAQASNGNTGTLVVGVTINQTSTANFSRFVPAGYYARLRTVNNTGTPTYVYRDGQEVLM